MGCGGYTMKDAGNWIAAVARWTKAGMPNRSQEVVEWIEENYCRECDQNIGGRCTLCGCNVSQSRVPIWNKLKMATETCPRGWWPLTELVTRCLKGELPMSKIEPVKIPATPGLYWAAVRHHPQSSIPGQIPGQMSGPTQMGLPTGQPEQPEPAETAMDYNAIIAVWWGPTSPTFRAFLFGEQGESRRPVSKRDIVRIGDRIEVP